MQPTSQLVCHLLAWLAAMVTMGGWTVSAFIRPRTGDERLRLTGDRLLAITRASGIVWAALNLGMAVLTSTDGMGHGEALGWCIAAGAALLGAVFTAFPHWESSLYALGLGAISLVASIAATETQVAVNHDVSGDAAMVATVAFTVLSGTWLLSRLPGALNPSSHSDADQTPDVRGAVHPVVRFRLRFLSAVAAGVVLVCDLATLWAHGGTLDQSAWWHLARAACAIAIAALAWIPASAAGWAAAAIGILGQVATVLAQRVLPGIASRPTTPDDRAFGYSVAEWPTLHNLVLHGRVNLFFLALAVVAVVTYLLLVVQLHRRGDRWPVGRTVAWLVGWAIIAFVTCSGVGRYAPAVFSVHMFMNLALNMLGAMILTLGGFITLVLRATPARPRSQPAGLREWVTATMHSRYLGFFYNPIIALVFMTFTYYVFYLTGIFSASLHTHWLHQLFYLHFLASGYIFYGLIIGVDQPPHPLPHIGRLALIIGAMPFHAFFGVILMSKTTVFAEEFLTNLGHPWMTARGLMHDQWVGGSIAWAGGEFPLVIALIALLTQWATQDAKESRRIDRHLDAGTDQSYDAYNEMLAQLAERDRTGR